MVIGYVLFFVLGLGLGYTIPGKGGFIALAVPLAFALLTAYNSGVDSDLLVPLVISLVVTVVGVLLGQGIDHTLERRAQSSSS